VRCNIGDCHIRIRRTWLAATSHQTDTGPDHRCLRKPRNRANGQDESTVEANALCQTQIPESRDANRAELVRHVAIERFEMRSADSEVPPKILASHQ
jgi:hypothetical protein